MAMTVYVGVDILACVTCAVVCTSIAVCVCAVVAFYRERLYANVEDLYAEVPREEDPYGYGDESIYDSICYYQAPVSV